ncbi:MAG: AraC family transcriptional regulator [Ruminococcaceae bacterium]|nr:AraC family transcriptional regulator [Oscillospiraceae bacterium]
MYRQLPVIRSASLFVATTEDEEEPVRTVTVYELEYMLEAGGTVEVNGKTWHTRKGDILIAKPGDRRNCTLPFCCLYMHLLDVTGDFKQVIDSIPSITHTQDPFYEDTFHSIIKLFLSSKTSDSLIAHGKLLQLIGKLSEQASRPDGISSQTNRTVSKAIRFINANYAKALTVDQLANYCNVSTSYLHKLFIQVRGISPHEAILDRRIIAAKAMLMNTQKSIAEVAVACGFQSHAYFSDCFKRRVGITPGKFRNNTTYRV